jgi:ABC-2 type transport system permease protein
MSGNINKLIGREIRRFAADKVMITLSIVLPLIICVLFIVVYDKGMISELPVALYDADNSETSRMLGRAIDASSSMKIVDNVNSIHEIEDGIKKGIYQGGFYFPAGMERDIKANRQTHPVLFKNSQNIIVCNYLLRDGLTILRTFNAGALLQKLRLNGVSEQQAMALVNPITIDVSILYNANFSYLTFLSPGFIFVQFQMSVMLSALLIFVREFERKTIDSALSIVNNNRILFVLGKTLPLFVVHCCMALMFIFVALPLGKIYMPGSYPEIIAITILFVLASYMPGLAIGAIIHDSFYATELSIFINMPTFIFSGYTFPLWAVPAALAAFAQVMPFTHFFTAFFKVALMNISIFYAYPEILKLLLFVILPVPIIFLALRKKIPLQTAGASCC